MKNGHSLILVVQVAQRAMQREGFFVVLGCVREGDDQKLTSEHGLLAFEARYK
jgi:hypothetical protein